MATTKRLVAVPKARLCGLCFFQSTLTLYKETNFRESAQSRIIILHFSKIKLSSLRFFSFSATLGHFRTARERKRLSRKQGSKRLATARSGVYILQCCIYSQGFVIPFTSPVHSTSMILRRNPEKKNCVKWMQGVRAIGRNQDRVVVSYVRKSGSGYPAFCL